MAQCNSALCNCNIAFQSWPCNLRGIPSNATALLRLQHVNNQHPHSIPLPASQSKYCYNVVQQYNFPSFIFTSEYCKNHHEPCVIDQIKLWGKYIVTSIVTYVLWKYLQILLSTITKPGVFKIKCVSQKLNPSCHYLFRNAVNPLIHHAESLARAQKGRGNSSEDQSHAAASA